MSSVNIGDSVEGDIDHGIVVDIYNAWIFYENEIGDVFCEPKNDVDLIAKLQIQLRKTTDFRVGDRVAADSCCGKITRIIKNQWCFVKCEEDGTEYPETIESLELIPSQWCENQFCVNKPLKLDKTLQVWLCEECFSKIRS